VELGLLLVAETTFAQEECNKLEDPLGLCWTGHLFNVGEMIALGLYFTKWNKM
jgi:hypothetical protein